VSGYCGLVWHPEPVSAYGITASARAAMLSANQGFSTLTWTKSSPLKTPGVSVRSASPWTAQVPRVPSSCRRTCRRTTSSTMTGAIRLSEGFFPNDRLAYELYSVIEEARLPALFHTGHSGMGSGLPGGGGIRLKYSNPIYVDDVAVDFPEMPIVLAHPSFPWQEEALSVAMHKAQVYIDLSGWSPKLFPPVLVQYANTVLQDKVLFGSDFPVITPDRWLRDLEKTAIKPELHQKILKDNAARLLGLSTRPC
jgi:hypothetical protein